MICYPSHKVLVCTFHLCISQPVGNLMFKGENRLIHHLKPFFICWLFLLVQQWMILLVHKQQLFENVVNLWNFFFNCRHILCWIHQILNSWWLPLESRESILFRLHKMVVSLELTSFSVNFFLLFPRSTNVSSFSSYWGSPFSFSFPSLPIAISNPAWSDFRGISTCYMVFFILV